MKGRIWTGEVACSGPVSALRAICSVFQNLKVKRMNKNTCDLGVISHRRAGSGHSPSSFVLGWFFEPRGQEPANSIINTTWIFQAVLVCSQNVSVANTFRFVTLEDVTRTHSAVNQPVCEQQRLVNTFKGIVQPIVAVWWNSLEV